MATIQAVEEIYNATTVSNLTKTNTPGISFKTPVKLFVEDIGTITVRDELNKIRLFKVNIVNTYLPVNVTKIFYSYTTCRYYTTEPVVAPVPPPVVTPTPAPAPAPILVEPNDDAVYFVDASDNYFVDPTDSYITTTTQPTPTPTPVTLDPKAFSITTPVNNATVTGVVSIIGVAGANWVNVVAYDEKGQKVGLDNTPKAGKFTLSVDTTKMLNGAHTLGVVGYSVPAGQPGGTAIKVSLSVTVKGGV